MASQLLLHMIFGLSSGILFVWGTKREFERLVAHDTGSAYLPSLVLRCCMVFFAAGCAYLLTGQPLSYEFAGAFVAGYAAMTLLVARRML